LIEVQASVVGRVWSTVWSVGQGRSSFHSLSQLRRTIETYPLQNEIGRCWAIRFECLVSSEPAINFQSSFNVKLDWVAPFHCDSTCALAVCGWAVWVGVCGLAVCGVWIGGLSVDAQPILTTSMSLAHCCVHALLSHVLWNRLGYLETNR